MNDRWLDQLAPEHAPPPPGWWPPAPGWWLLAFLALALIVAAILFWRQPRRRLRRATLRELNRIRARPEEESAAVAPAIQNLLRRYALAAFGPERVARLQGAAWLTFLNEHSEDAFAGPRGEALLAASYGAAPRGDAAANRAAWLAAAEQFVRRAERPPPRKVRVRHARGAAGAPQKGRPS
jgi:hypothetical protein